MSWSFRTSIFESIYYKRSGGNVTHMTIFVSIFPFFFNRFIKSKLIFLFDTAEFLYSYWKRLFYIRLVLIFFFSPVSSSPAEKHRFVKPLFLKLLSTKGSSQRYFWRNFISFTLNESHYFEKKILLHLKLF